MNSTPLSPASAMRLTALPPPPPTPITLMRAPVRTMSSSRRIRSFSEPWALKWRASILSGPFLGLEKFFEERPQTSRDSSERAGAYARGLGLHVVMGVDHDADRRGEYRIADVIGESTDALGRRATHRQVEDLFGDLGHALEQGRPTGQDDAGVERLLVPGPANLIPQQMADLFRPRLQDL